MKLNKLQRYTAYCVMLAEAEQKMGFKNYEKGLCWLTIYFDGENEEEEDMILINHHLPELDAKLSLVNYRYFVDKNFAFKQDKAGWQKRIELLKQCIIETHP